MKKILSITLPSLVLALVVAVALTEVVVRATWDQRRGKPGFFAAHPVRIERLAPNYDGWFAGVPVRINSLGFRDDREYSLDKAANTFRIMVLGDSVTFGHGSIYEHSYPRLLEQRLQHWRQDVDWQVWNLGVPGYNTSQELATLLELGPTYLPDLVIVGFFENDVLGNFDVQPATRVALWRTGVRTWLASRVFALEWFRKQALLLRYRLLASEAERVMLEGMATHEALLARPAEVVSLREQQLTSPPRFSDAEVAGRICPSPQEVTFSVAGFEAIPGFDRWTHAVERLQALHVEGTYAIAFFVNAAPRVCPDADMFDDRGTRELDDHVLSILGRDTPAVSSFSEFMHYRPSDMPLAGGHSLGNSNAVKADVLFEFLRDQVLPQLDTWQQLEQER